MESPFTEHIHECKRRMRKLRKKIYKHNTSKTSAKHSHKQNDLTSALIGIFERRQIPSPIIETLKNKRNIDLFSLKSLVIGNQSELWMELPQLRKKTSSQEEQVQKLYSQHRQRMSAMKRCQTPRLSHRIQNYISSTEAGISSQEDSLSKKSQSEFADIMQFENSLQQNIFSEEKVGQKCEHEVQVQAFSCFEMGESSLMSGENIFNF